MPVNVKDMEITAIYYLIPALIMFCCGVYGFITRKNINFAVFNRFLFPEAMEGMFFTLFAIAIAAAETAIAIAIIINIYRAAKNIDVRSLNEMKF